MTANQLAVNQITEKPCNNLSEMVSNWFEVEISTQIAMDHVDDAVEGLLAESVSSAD